MNNWQEDYEKWNRSWYKKFYTALTIAAIVVVMYIGAMAILLVYATH
jgi:hypothetical protein